jgi:hypothetical protein
VYHRHLSYPEWDDIADMLFLATPQDAMSYLEESMETFACINDPTLYSDPSDKV